MLSGRIGAESSLTKTLFRVKWSNAPNTAPQRVTNYSCVNLSDEFTYQIEVLVDLTRSRFAAS